MRRLIVIGSLFIVMMSILSGCTLDSSSSSPRSSSPVASTVNNSSETYPEVEPTEPILYHDLKMLTSSMGIGTTCSTETGFYELDLSGALPTLFYIDYATHQKLPLCSRPECQHNDETCNAVIPNAIGVVNFQQHLLVFCSAIEDHPSILQIGYDGNDRVTLVELNSADRYDRAFAGDQNVLFTIVEAYFKSLKNDTESIPGEWELYSYSLSSGEKHIVARETPYSSIGGISGKFYYYLNLEQGKLFSLDLETGELSTVADNLDLGTTPETSRFYGFWDNHFMYINFITNDDYSLSYDVYGIDLESHAITNVSLMCNYHGNRYIWLQWETPTEFLVINGENRYTQTLYAPDGTTYQEEQIEPQFALIKKEDYWNSVPNYIPIESLQN